MKILQRITILIVIALIAVVPQIRAQGSDSLTVHWYHWSTTGLIRLFQQPQRGGIWIAPAPQQAQEGIWVAVNISDNETEALSITLNYRDQLGRDLCRMDFVPRHYRDQPEWTNHLFLVGKVQVRSILITPLKATAATRLIEVNETN